MNCLNLNVPQFRQAVAILGKGVATEIVNTFDPDYLPSLNEILEKHVNPARLNTTKGEPHRTKQLRDIYDNNAELKKAGSFESYMAYIDSIFPESTVKDIVYHGTMPGTATATNANSGDTNATFPGYVTYFSTARTYAESLGIKDLVKVVLPAIVNVKNPYYATSPIADTPRGTQFTGPRNIKEDMPQHDAVVGSDAGQTIGNTVAIFNPEQIHVLGSKKDIANFKSFMSGPKTPEVPSPGTVNSLTPKQQMIKEQTSTLLTPAEAKDLYDRYVPQSFMAMLRSWFFKVPTTNSNEKDAFRIVDASFLAYKAGREAYGAYIDGVLYLANLGTVEQPLVDRDVLKHELVHKIM
jgi:hypothetical protein